MLNKYNKVQVRPGNLQQISYEKKSFVAIIHWAYFQGMANQKTEEQKEGFGANRIKDRIEELNIELQLPCSYSECFKTKTDLESNLFCKFFVYAPIFRNIDEMNQ